MDINQPQAKPRDHAIRLIKAMFRFSIRELLMLALIVALVVAWQFEREQKLSLWAEQKPLKSVMEEQRQMLAQMRQEVHMSRGTIEHLEHEEKILHLRVGALRRALAPPSTYAPPP